MIMVDNKKLESNLYEVISSIYSTNNTYLVIESIEAYIDEDDNFSLFIKGRYGVEKENGFCNRFEIQINPEWSYDFIKGYFYKYIEDQM